MLQECHNSYIFIDVTAVTRVTELLSMLQKLRGDILPKSIFKRTKIYRNDIWCDKLKIKGELFEHKDTKDTEGFKPLLVFKSALADDTNCT